MSFSKFLKAAHVIRYSQISRKMEGKIFYVIYYVFFLLLNQFLIDTLRSLGEC